jgi:hypothetical protein
MASSGKTKLLLRPLLKRRRDLAFVGRTLFFTPVTHYLRGVEFLSSRWNDIPRGVSFAHQLYNGWPWADFDGEQNVQFAFHLERDWASDEAKASRELCEIMEQRALPPVEPIVDYATHLRTPGYTRGEGSAKFLRTAALGACTEGDFDRAEAIATEYMARPSPWAAVYSVALATDDVRFDEDMHWRFPYLLRTLQTDRSKVIPLLHDWEAYSVKNCGLTKYWTPTPFPCEL